MVFVYIKNLLKRFGLWLKFKLRANDPKVQKEKKKVEKMEKWFKHHSLWGKLCLYATGMNDLKIRNYHPERA